MDQSFLRTLFLPLLLICTLIGDAYGQKKSDKVIKTQKQTDEEAVASQKAIDQTADKTQSLVEQYRETLARTDSTKIYNDQVEKLIGSQDQEMSTMTAKIQEIGTIHRDVVPLMLRMIKTIEDFVALDMPFLQSERKERTARLKEMMDRADVTTSEKFRRILEAYQIENEYGRTIEGYRDKIEIDGKTYTVDFLRVGRIMLAYQSLDGEKTGYWDRAQKSFVPLTSDYQNYIRDGLKIARKQAAPNLMTIPVPSAQAVGGGS
jgi:hypothetical protein